jgi:hypothetical protein
VVGQSPNHSERVSPEIPLRGHASDVGTGPHGIAFSLRRGLWRRRKPSPTERMGDR